MVPPRSPAPSTKAFCSSMVAMTGAGVFGSNSVELAPSMPATLRAYSIDHALQAQADAQGRDLPLAGPLQGTELALDAADPEPTGHEHRIDPTERLLGPGLGLALVTGDPADRDLRVVVETAGTHRLGHREVGVGQVDVLADQGDLDGVLGAVDAAQQLVPVVPVDVAEVEPEATDDEGVQALLVQDLGDVVDARGVDRSRAGLGVRRRRSARSCA